MVSNLQREADLRKVSVEFWTELKRRFPRASEPFAVRSARFILELKQTMTYGEIARQLNMSREKLSKMVRKVNPNHRFRSGRPKGSR